MSKSTAVLTYAGDELNKEKKARVKSVYISDGFIYISRDTGRWYWVLSKIEPPKRPIITFNDRTRTIRLGKNKMVVKSEKTYQKAKSYLAPYPRK